MQQEQMTLILTSRLDTVSQAFFNALRLTHFPPERNFLKAHLTLFHQLPDTLATRQYLSAFKFGIFDMSVSGLRYLGAGVAYRIESVELQTLHLEMSRHFQDVLIPQDRQRFQPHITIQNKVTPEASRILLEELTGTFESFTVQATGLDLWEYHGGPWRHSFGYDFAK
ncbi:2'-5' RNA ligase family protein [Mucilaginibacter aquaedulcis]|uniref:2'-5' RNA ligase family protein n=1 Tax=Mucilaginibacter aquaedulcis TaxID=1187081 RepID=UPI0025B5D342|nr:2'-5' RNA ligase family protein [Mucilaginibacter aquaedulcis]MDN3548169.1 2'-5' RNA ligase family protein [Mucilaginibacter aquaedulcis]